MIPAIATGGVAGAKVARKREPRFSAFVEIAITPDVYHLPGMPATTDSGVAWTAHTLSISTAHAGGQVGAAGPHRPTVFLRQPYFALPLLRPVGYEGQEATKGRRHEGQEASQGGGGHIPLVPGRRADAQESGEVLSTLAFRLLSRLVCWVVHPAIHTLVHEWDLSNGRKD